MECPYCHTAMETGKLIIDERTHPIWQKEGADYTPFDSFLGIDGKEIRGLPESPWSRKKITANYCPACRKFQFDGWVDKF